MLPSINSVATAFILHCITVSYARNFSTIHLLAPADARSLYQLINPHAALPPPLRQPCTVLEAITYAHRTALESKRLFMLCCTHTRWHFDGARQACEYHCTGKQRHKTGLDSAAQNVRQVIDAYWNHMHDAHLETVHEQMTMVDRTVQMFEASLTPWLWSAMDQHIFKFKQKMAHNMIVGSAFMTEQDRKLKRILDTFGMRFAGRRVGDQAVLIEQTLDEVAEVIAKSEASIGAMLWETSGMFQKSMRVLGLW